jgi:hypothetical protein
MPRYGLEETNFDYLSTNIFLLSTNFVAQPVSYARLLFWGKVIDKASET